MPPALTGRSLLVVEAEVLDQPGAGGDPEVELLVGGLEIIQARVEPLVLLEERPHLFGVGLHVADELLPAAAPASLVLAGLAASMTVGPCLCEATGQRIDESLIRPPIPRFREHEERGSAADPAGLFLVRLIVRAVSGQELAKLGLELLAEMP